MPRTAGSTADQTRARILETARALFAEQGYAGTSVRDIAEHLGITKAALYYHFASKQDVLAALVAPLLDGVDAIASEFGAHAPRPARREAALRAFVELLATRGPAMQVIFADPSARHDAVARIDPVAAFGRLEQALAGSEDPGARIGVRCALGAARSGTIGALRDHRGTLPAADRERIVTAALAAWVAADV
jgi:AcrR family transcriptional regulator